MISKFQKDQHNDRIIIYIDKSKSEINQINASLIYTTNFSYYQQKAWNLGSKYEVFDTELFTIKKVIDFTYEKTDIWIREIWIFSDNQAALKRLKSREVRAGQYYTNQVRAGIEKLRQKNNQIQINLQWVPDHMNIYGNERADEKAKLGSKLRTVHHEAITLLNFLKRKVQECCLDD